MADPVISEIKYLGGGTLDFLEVRIPDDYPDPGNLRLVIYDRSHNGSNTASPAARDIYDITAVGTLYTEDVDMDGNDDDGVLHYTVGSSENGTNIRLHQQDAVGLYNVATGETYGLYNWSGTPYTVSTATGDPFAGQEAQLLDSSGQINGVSSLERQQNGDYALQTAPDPGASYICFTQGTQILTPSGDRAVEALRVGDEVITKDFGVQTIRWIGRKDFANAAALRADDRPITIKAHAFGPGVPTRDTTLSPNHAVLNDHWKASLFFGDSEVLTAAKTLLNTDYAFKQSMPSVSYFHILLDQHSLVSSNGLWSESLYLGSECMKMLSPHCRSTILNMFPGLSGDISRYGPTARQQVRSNHASLLF